MGKHFRIQHPSEWWKTWQKCPHGDLASISDAFTCRLLKRILKRLFLESGLSRIFTVSNFRNTLAVTMILFSKSLEFVVDSRNGTKNSENVFHFSYNCIWSGSCNFSQSSRGYLRSAVNLLTNTPKTSPKTRENIFGINFPRNYEKHDKSALMEISQVFGTHSHVHCQSVFSNGAFQRVV